MLMVYLYHAFYVWKAMDVDMLTSSPQEIAAIACDEETRPAVLTAWAGKWSIKPAHATCWERNNIYRLPTRVWEGNVFRRVCLSFFPWEGDFPYDHYPWCIGLHHPGMATSPPPGPRPVILCTGTPARVPCPLLMASGGQDWRPAQTCLLEDPHQCWHLVAGMYRQYASYWNASLFRSIIFKFLFKVYPIY